MNLKRRNLLLAAGLLGTAGVVGINRWSVMRSSNAAEGAGGTITVNGRQWEKVMKTDKQWRQQLNEDQYRILREEGTEPAHSSHLNNEHGQGEFVCAGCGLPLFQSATKFESGTGWPSFFKPIDGAVETSLDFKLVYPRTEYHCARCGGHQGHIFKDGPEPTGQRWCNNGLAIRFVPAGDEKKNPDDQS